MKGGMTKSERYSSKALELAARELWWMTPREKPISQILTRSVVIEASGARILILMVVSVIESAGTLKLVNV